VYTGKEVPLTAGDPTQVLYRQGVSTEHSWPRSRGSDGWPAEADLHILFPADERTNSRRGNLPYGTVPDDEVVTWTADGDRFRGRPAGEWVSRVGRDAFEPPDPVKGDLARAHLYFALTYPGRARGAFFDRELPDLVQWSMDDPPSREELVRDSVIQVIQGNCNPFVHWPELALEWLDAADGPDACRDLQRALEGYGLESVVQARGGTCVLLAVGPAAEILQAGDPAEDLRSWFARSRWEEDLSRAADGPGTTAFTFARRSVVCDVSAGAPSALEGGEIVVAHEYELNVECRRSVR
jgi:hypothetical protein